MRILLTNDDGFYAPGLRALREQLLPLGDVTVKGKTKSVAVFEVRTEP